MATDAAHLIGPALEKICEHAGGRKLVKLRHEAKACLAAGPCRLVLLPQPGVRRLWQHRQGAVQQGLPWCWVPPEA